jgi:epoxyqueuosine reductase
MRYAEDLLPALEEAGMKAVAVRPGRAREACGDVTERCRRGETDPRVSTRFFGRYVAPEYLATPEWAKSLFVVAISSSVSVVLFDIGDGPVQAAIPPTYVYGRDESRALSLLRDSAGAARIEPALGPRKVLAARSGLALYGRNNLCYVEGMGSAARLAAFYCSLPLGTGTDCWGEPCVMDRCSSCGACVRSCPAGCFTEGCFIVGADRCLTFANESAEDDMADIPRSWHNALVGCLRCQTVCPENAGRMNPVFSGESFSMDETTAIRDARDLESLDPGIREKLARLNMNEYLDVLWRNLGFLGSA